MVELGGASFYDLRESHQMIVNQTLGRVFGGYYMVVVGKHFTFLLIVV